MPKYVLGIDTSCYTTSIALINTEGDIVSHSQKILDVKQNTTGLRQSDAFFQHSNNLPGMLKEVNIDIRDLCAVCVSAKPRNIESSYMPVFRAGINLAESISAVGKLPIYYTSHQENHITAGLYSAEKFNNDSFYALHLSGGTTEILSVNKNESDMEIEILGNSTDLHVGQFVDRVGVKLGLNFPAGAELEKLAFKAGDTDWFVKSYMKDGFISFSGAESAMMRQIDAGRPKEEAALNTFLCIAKTLYKWIDYIFEHNGIRPVLLIGGVASNSIIKTRLNELLIKKYRSAKIYYCNNINLSRDNACGTALIGLAKWRTEYAGN